MAAFGTGANRSLGRGGSPGFRFTLYAALSIVVMFLDQRGEWLERARFVLQAAAYPLELAVSSPSATWHWLQESFQTRDALRAENERLRAQQRDLAVRAMRYDALALENAQLRGLKEALPPVAERWLVAEVVNVQLNSLRQRVLVNRGTTNAAYKGQAVLDDKGLLGQTLHVGPWSAEVILITDPEHAVPVQVERNGLRTIAVGAGDTASLALPYLPANADVKSGDLLVTSGLGGVFPAGYPVARISEVHRDAVQPLAQVRAIPLARVDVDREVVLVWFKEGHPASPASASSGDLKSGNPAMQPQAVPHPQPGSAGPNGPAATSTAPLDKAARPTAAPPSATGSPPGRTPAAAPRPSSPPPADEATEAPGDTESPPMQSDAPAPAPSPGRAPRRPADTSEAPGKTPPKPAPAESAPGER